MKLSALALALGAELRPAGADAAITGVAGAQAASPEHIVFAEDPGALPAALASHAAAVIVSAKLAPASSDKPLLVVPQPRFSFAQAAHLLKPADPFTGVHPTAVIDPSATLGEAISVAAYAVIEAGAQIGSGTRIGPGAVIGEGVKIGSACRIHARVVIYPGSELGNHVVVKAGAVLGSDGFGYVRDAVTGEYLQFPQQGRLVIEDDVEIGANTTIDRGALEETRISRGTKLDNLIHIGHNVSIGRNVVIAAQTGISGSSAVGDGAILGGQVGMGDHAMIGERVILGAQAGIPSRKKIRGPGIVFWGTPARPIK